MIGNIYITPLVNIFATSYFYFLAEHIFIVSLLSTAIAFVPTIMILIVNSYHMRLRHIAAAMLTFFAVATTSLWFLPLLLFVPLISITLAATTFVVAATLLLLKHIAYKGLWKRYLRLNIYEYISFEAEAKKLVIESYEQSQVKVHVGQQLLTKKVSDLCKL